MKVQSKKKVGKISPFVRIQEKNKKIKELEQHLSDIATLLGCQPVITDIMPALLETKNWRTEWVNATSQYDELQKSMGARMAKEIETATFSLALENEKLKDKVESLTREIDNKVNRVVPRDTKGFWDFTYRIFKLI